MHNSCRVKVHPENCEWSISNKLIYANNLYISKYELYSEFLLMPSHGPV